jgi:hypothetical protein
MRINCLHTVDSNVSVFQSAADALCLAPGTLGHVVRNDLLAAAQAAGSLSVALEEAAALALLELVDDCDGVLLTCSTFGRAAELASARSVVPILRVDAALAEETARRPGKVVTLCTAATTLAPTCRLLTAAAERTCSDVQVLLVPGAWELFLSGDEAGYYAAIADMANNAYEAGADIVAFAQASMTGAARLVDGGPTPLMTPHSGIVAMIKAIQARAPLQRH